MGELYEARGSCFLLLGPLSLDAPRANLGWGSRSSGFGAAIYNAKPMELDANAAAAVYTRGRYADAADELLETPVGNLVRSNTGPENPAHLLTRTVCFLFQFRAIAERLAGEVGVAAHLAVYDKYAGDLWRTLAGD